MANLESQGELSKIGAQALNLSLLNSTNNNLSVINFGQETSYLREDSRFREHNILDELNDEGIGLEDIQEDKEEDNFATGKVVQPSKGSLIREEWKGKYKVLQEQNEDLIEKNLKFEEKIERLNEQVKRLHEAQKKSGNVLLESQDEKHKLEDENDHLNEKMNLIEKELQLYKKKLKDKEEEMKGIQQNEGLKEKYEKLLEDKTKRNVELEMRLESQIIKNRKSFRVLVPLDHGSPSPEKNSFEEPEAVPKEPRIVPRVIRDPIPNNDPNEIDLDNLPLELMLDYDMLKKDNATDRNHLVQPKSPANDILYRGQKSQRDATSALKDINFGVKPSRATLKSPSMSYALDMKPKNTYNRIIRDNNKYGNKGGGGYRKVSPFNPNSKLLKHGLKVKNIFNKKESGILKDQSKLGKIEYSYDYLGINSYSYIMKTIANTENLNKGNFKKLENFKCLSDHVYRLNKWKNKKRKILVVTSTYVYIFNNSSDIKRKFRLQDIKKVITRGKQDNFVCFLLKKSNDEILDYFKKNELLLFLSRQFKALKLDIKIDTKATTFNFISTRNETVNLDPNQLKSFKPVYNSTFNYASQSDRLMNISILKKGFMGINSKFKKQVALVTDLGIIVFSSIQWDLERFIPFVGSKIMARKSDKKECMFKLSDQTDLKIRFESEIESKKYLRVLSQMMKVFRNLK